MRKLAVKRLTASDLTFFDYHFRENPAGKQKAINLNADVFIGELYPALPEIGERFPLDLDIAGPGNAGVLNRQRKILKQQKNWRLNGELIYDPTEDSTRFHVLQPGDIAVFEFLGDVEPKAGSMILLSTNVDPALHQYFDAIIPGGVRTMVRISQSELETLVAESDPDAEHPIRNLLLDEILESVSTGGDTPITEGDTLTSAPRVPTISRERLKEARKHADDVGRKGEEYVCSFLEQLVTEGAIQGYEWVADENAISPFDFRVFGDDGEIRVLDVKATTGSFDRRVHISLSELRQIGYGEEEYDLYRVYNVTPNGADLRIARNLRDMGRQIVATFADLPAGISVDGISVSVGALTFDDTVISLNNETGDLFEST